jgi:Mg2+ and Co2+ transporter CorA
VTVLAFVFIPINLASSVYGMNVQEINDTGHKIWVFVVTSIVFLILSGLAWVWRHALKELFTGFWEILEFSYDLFRGRGLFH